MLTLGPPSRSGPGSGTRSGGLDYRATTAQWHADRSAKRPKPAKLATNEALRRYVQDRLAGRISAPDGTVIEGPRVVWNGRRHQQPDPAVIGGGQGSLQAARRDRRALLCPQPRSRRYAPDLASGPREHAQAIPASRRRPQPIVGDAPTHRRRHPEGGRGGRNWRLVRACYARWEPSWSFRSSSSSRRMAKPPSPRYASPWRETRSMTPF